MKEADNYAQWQKENTLTANEADELVRLSELLQGDGLRYERQLRAEEEVNEL